MELLDYENEHRERLRSSLAECTVLLKSNGDFPLESPGKIAAFGNGVRHTVKGGTGSGEVNSRFFVNIEQGLKEAGFEITTENWLDAYDEALEAKKKNFIKELKAEAKARHENPIMYGMGKVMPAPDYDLPPEGEGETAIYVLSRISGEGNDREPIPGDIKLSASEIRDILELDRKYARFMLVLNVGGVIDLTEVSAVRNILLLSQLGVDTGTALADILLGKANPSGKLTTTWSSLEDYQTVGTFGDHDDTFYREGIYVGYRYFDSTGKKPLFPFGYGLSYTSFETDALQVSREGTLIRCPVKIKNTGRFSGKETVRVFLSAPDGRLDKPYQELAGFAKTRELAPGEEQELTVSFDLTDYASYDTERSAFILEAGDYLIRLGSSGAETKPIAVLRTDREAIVTQAKKCCGEPGFTDWKPEVPRKKDIPEDLPVLKIGADEIRTNIISYSSEDLIEENIRSLSDDQLVYAAIGAFSERAGKLMSVIGNASSRVAGAAGETTNKLEKEGFAPLVMSDGPAGLRLTPHFFKDAKGIHGIDQSVLPESVIDLLPGYLKWLLRKLHGIKRPPEGIRIQTQYCTAIPIGTALAQSWNTELAQMCGDIVGDEMERFGVQLWLAPALNIHRSIRCGRNFEYFSEDPLISGKFAAAVTRGVQAHPGCGATIKHYAANNQEFNRYGNNSHVSERAMREIYLKGFGICIRESGPCAVMTSYNLLNGQHTSERRDLCEDILRREFGFDGVIMTDWVIGNGMMNSKADIYPHVMPQLSAAAGNDLFMPGCKADYKNMLRGLKDGSLSREQLMINASRVYRMCQRLGRHS